MPKSESSENSEKRPADLSNLRLGEFLLLRRLGSGGMADVYLAEQSSLGRHVAVKILKSDTVAGGPDVLLKRFEQEARAAGGLSHPNLVQIITTGREGNISYIVQEYVPGLNLSQWIKKHGFPDYGTGLKWMQQIAAALRAASEAGIVHRDVKPENIMLTRSNVAKVTDFGLAQLNQPSSPQMNLTQIGTTMGTPWYMSPEQIQGNKLDYRSDQYSFGITCYHMFAGRPPFPGKNAVTVAVQHLQEQPLPLKELRADLPLEICDVIRRMMEKKPADRFQTPEELEAALEKLNSVPVNSRLAVQTGWVGNVLRSLPDLRKVAAAALTVLALSFVAGRQLDRSVMLPQPEKAEAVPKEATAIRQYAVAMLQPDRRAAWEAVINNFPDTAESDLAELRLGVALMSSVVPDIDGAYKVFSSVRSKGEVIPQKAYLRLLGMIGQAYALKERERNEESEALITEIKDVLLHYEGNLELDLDRAPVELRSFFERIQLSAQQSMNADFGGFRP